MSQKQELNSNFTTGRVLYPVWSSSLRIHLWVSSNHWVVSEPCWTSSRWLPDREETHHQNSLWRRHWWAKACMKPISWKKSSMLRRNFVRVLKCTWPIAKYCKNSLIRIWRTISLWAWSSMMESWRQSTIVILQQHYQRTWSSRVGRPS